MEMDEGVQIFVSECKELLEDMESALLGCEKNPNDPDLINQVFRSVHTIKGSAGLFGFEDIIKFTHVLENVLDDVRDCLIPVTADIITVFMQCKDQIEKYIDALMADGEVDEEESTRLTELLKLYQTGQTSTSIAEVQDDSSVKVAEEESQLDASIPQYHISFYLGEDSFKQGFSPVVLMNELAELGEIISATPHLDKFPEENDYLPEDSYMGWFVVLGSNCSKSEIAEVFQYLDETSVHILPPESSIPDYQDMVTNLPEDEDKAIGQILIDVGTLTQRELDEALLKNRETGELTGNILIQNGAVQPAVVESALIKQEQTRQAKKKAIDFIRIDASKLDSLVNLVGELVIFGAKMNQLTKKYSDDELGEAVSEITETLEEIREVALGLRMVQLSGTFNKFQRVVRDTSSKLGKEINLKVSGGETELDKSVIDQISDPLMHIIRNAIDHGIETPDERISKGKVSEGTITLNAFHETGAICIEVKDDGRGLSKEKILEKAKEKKLIDISKNYSDKDIWGLVFEPGFSTAAEVTDLSGRGVGMDVVKRNIESLRGHIEIESEYGSGTEIKIHMPLTLAIIEGFHVGVVNESFILPLDMVVECISMSDALNDEASHHNYIKLREDVLPLIDLKSFLKISSTSNETAKNRNIVVVTYSGRKAGLIVDALYGEIQTVIKPLGRVFEGAVGSAGFTILGSGNVALILDVPGLIQGAINQEHDIFDGLSLANRNTAESIPIPASIE